MTCMNCVASVKEHLSNIDGITHVAVDLKSGEATLVMRFPVETNTLQNALPKKYSLVEHLSTANVGVTDSSVKDSKLKQLKPLLLIFLYLFTAAILLNSKPWNATEAMLDFMGLFYIVFSFFKFLDLKGFTESFAMYDPLAKVAPIYGKIYPFIELGLGLLFLYREQITFALITTLVILGITTIGVAKTLFNKKSIRCACLGTALKLPMTEATVIENAIMLAMAIIMLLHQLG